MKIVQNAILVMAVLVLAVGLVYAGHYKLVSVSISSATVPVQVIPGGQKDSWLLKPRASATSLLCFSVATNAASPTAVPSPTALMEVQAGMSLFDSLSGINGPQDPTVMQDSIWCVNAATPAATAAVDGIYR
jgi:hypothetical protein